MPSEFVLESIEDAKGMSLDTLLRLADAGELSVKFVDWLELHLEGWYHWRGSVDIPQDVRDEKVRMQKAAAERLSGPERRLMVFVLAAMSCVTGRIENAMLAGRCVEESAD